MADPEHLAILKQGVEAWNAWRKSHPEIEAHLVFAHLAGARLAGANLDGASLGKTNLDGATLNAATLGYTVFADVNLSSVIGLDSVHHIGPSTIGIDTIARSQGKIPTAFLRGCGLQDWVIESVKL